MTKPYKQYRHAIQLKPGDSDSDVIAMLIKWALEHPNYEPQGKWEITLEKHVYLGPDMKDGAISISAKYYLLK